MTEIPDGETMKAFNKGIVEEFRTNGGVVGGPFEGATLLLLTSTGAKSGQPRLAPLAMKRRRDRPGISFVASLISRFLSTPGISSFRMRPMLFS